MGDLDYLDTGAIEGAGDVSDLFLGELVANCVRAVAQRGVVDADLVGRLVLKSLVAHVL